MYHQHVREWRDRRLSLGANDEEINAINKIDFNTLVAASELLCEAAAQWFECEDNDQDVIAPEDRPSTRYAVDLLLFLADKQVGLE